MCHRKMSIKNDINGVSRTLDHVRSSSRRSEHNTRPQTPSDKQSSQVDPRNRGTTPNVAKRDLTLITGTNAFICIEPKFLIKNVRVKTYKNATIFYDHERQSFNKSFSYQDTPPLRSFLVCILNFDKTSKIFSKCNHLFGRYLGETHFVHKSRAVTRLKNKEKQNVIG